MTTSLVYMPLWLNERNYITAPPNGSMTITEADEFIQNQTSVENLATVPLASFVASFISSNFFKQADQFIGHKTGYFLGSLISLCGCFLVAFAATPTSSVFELYVVATFFGAGSSITMISSLCITADMIGKKETLVRDSQSVKKALKSESSLGSICE
jgi:MFS family permease